MPEPVSLIRWHWAQQAATLVPGSNDFRPFERQKNPHGSPLWLPDVTAHGYFDCIGWAVVAIYRQPADPSVLWFHFGPRELALTESSSSSFSPTFATEEPQLASASLPRRFQLFDAGKRLLDFSYRLDDLELRRSFSIDPFPSWPDEEEDYDLLYFVHRILESGRWRNVLGAPRGATEITA